MTDFRLHIGICILLLLCLAPPAGAVLLVTSYRGTVTSLDAGTGILALNADATSECSYQGAARTCGWSPMTPVPVAGSVPSADTGSVVAAGDRAEATIAGGDGGQWVAVGRIATEQGEDVLSALTGDPSQLHTPLAEGYQLGYQTAPDCSNCSGTLCQARQASLTIGRKGKTFLEKVLVPGEVAEYAAPDGSSVMVTFLGGTTSSRPCGAEEGMAGPQPFSSFTVQIQNGSLPPTAGTSVEPSPPPTGGPVEMQTSGSSIPSTAAPTGLFPVTAGILVAACLLACRKKR